jgi:recombination protein RecR
VLKINSLEKLVHELNRLPGIGPKTAQRLAYHILKTPELSNKMQDALKLVQENVHLCKQCFSYTDEGEFCYYCKDSTRREDIICVVEEPSDIARIESSGAFKGKYHVLQGSISPLDNIGPNDLKIRELLARVEAGQHGEESEVKELILALDPDLEGDTTALYLAKLFSDKNVKVSRIASGVPLGSDIDYVDDRTLGLALQNRLQL